MTLPTPPANPASEVLCPHFEDHTYGPAGYIQWHAWAEDMSKTHEQVKCAGCGLYAIWLPKDSLSAHLLSPAKEEESNG